MRLTIKAYVGPELNRDIREFAADSDLTVSGAVRTLIRAGLAAYAEKLRGRQPAGEGNAEDA